MMKATRPERQNIDKRTGALFAVAGLVPPISFAVAHVFGLSTRPAMPYFLFAWPSWLMLERGVEWPLAAQNTLLLISAGVNVLIYWLLAKLYLKLRKRRSQVKAAAFTFVGYVVAYVLVALTTAL